jgi:hypothetical protein
MVLKVEGNMGPVSTVQLLITDCWNRPLCIWKYKKDSNQKSYGLLVFENYCETFCGTRFFEECQAPITPRF